MFLNKKPKEPGAKGGAAGAFANLSRSQRRRVDKAVTAAKGDPDRSTSVQASIPYLAMYCNFSTSFLKYAQIRLHFPSPFHQATA